MRTALWILLMIATTEASAAESQLRLLALGDSYTIGEGVPEGERWPVQLVERLREDGIEFAPPQIVARTGWTTDELSAAIDRARLAPPYDAVTLLIGVNNQYRGYALDQYRNEFGALLERALAFAGGRAARVFVLSIPDWGVTPFARASGRDTGLIARELDAYDAIARDVAQSRGVAFVDVTAVSRARGADAAMLAPDGLHPSGAMYRLWVDALLPAMLQQLRVGPGHAGH